MSAEAYYRFTSGVYHHLIVNVTMWSLSDIAMTVKILNDFRLFWYIYVYIFYWLQTYTTIFLFSLPSPFKISNWNYNLKRSAPTCPGGRKGNSAPQVLVILAGRKSSTTRHSLPVAVVSAKDLEMSDRRFYSMLKG